MPSPQELALLFVDAVNRQDLARMGALMGASHRLTDSLGRVVEGREAVLAAWKGYFRWVPDYRIEVREVLADRELVGMLGWARGTFAPKGELMEENRWEIPAAWRAAAIDGLVESWQVYADNKPVYRNHGEERESMIQSFIAGAIAVSLWDVTQARAARRGRRLRFSRDRIITPQLPLCR